MAKQDALSFDHYNAFLTDLKTRIRQARVKAVLAVNKELILLYWQIGWEILTRQQQQGWGTKVIERLAKDLKREFPQMKGFSRTNLMYMRAFAEAWPDEQFVHQLGGQIPWKHNCIIISKIKDRALRVWYIQKTVEYGWSRNSLEMQIETRLHQRQGEAVTNFERTLPPAQSDLARQLIKDPYNFDFLNLTESVQERELERALVDRIKEFLLELGVGFAFVGSQYRLEVEGQEFFIDMLFYHLKLRCFVVIDLKVTEFRPEYSGKMNFYVAAVNAMLSHPDDQPTIGIILCKSKNKIIAEYALSGMAAPIAVATHSLPEDLKSSLPTIEQLESELEAAVSELEEDSE